MGSLINGTRCVALQANVSGGTVGGVWELAEEGVDQLIVNLPAAFFWIRLEELKRLLGKKRMFRFLLFRRVLNCHVIIFLVILS